MAIYTSGATHHKLGDLKGTSLNVQRSLANFTFHLTLEGNLTDEPLSSPFELDVLRAEIEVESEHGFATYLGPAWRYGQNYVNRSDGDQGESAFYLEFQMTSAQVEMVEALRKGGGLRFLARAVLTVRTDEGEHLRADATAAHSVSQLDWTQMLNQIGYGRTVFLEVGLPRIESSDEYRLVIEHLDHAMSRRNSADWEGAIAECRKALELLSLIAGKPARELPPQQDRETWTGNERTRQVLENAIHLAAPSVAAGRDRADAQAMLAMTAALARLITGPRP